jgi:hypothetical protein
MQDKVVGTEVEKEEAATSCGCFERLKEEGFEFPFTQSIGFNLKKMELYVTPWVVVVHKKTPSGRKSAVGSKILLLNYCPFCGQEIFRKEKEQVEEATLSATGDEYLDVPSTGVSAVSEAEDDSKES